MRFCTLRALLTPLVCALAIAAPAIGVEINQPAPEIDTQLLNRKTLKAKDLRGKVVVTVFWASWCPTCRGVLPELQKFYEENNARGLEMLALSIDENVRDAKAMIKAKGVLFPAGMRSDAWYEQYGRVSGTPTWYITDRQGVIRHRVVGPLGMEKLGELIRPLM